MVAFVEREVIIAAPSAIPISLSAVSFNSEHYHSELFHQLGISRPSKLLHSIDKRCSDYLAGRIAAKAAISHSQKPFPKLDSSLQVNCSREGAPIFPCGFVGSISHSGNFAMAAVSKGNHLSSIGIDIEQTIPEEDYELVKRQVLTHDEVPLLEQLSITNNVALTLIFSAKESLFKCLHPEIKRFFDFTAAKVIAVDQFTNDKHGWSSFTIELLETLSECLSKGRRFTGFYRHYLEHIITLIVRH
ncbi:MAG: 4'-phosphopantetheinyl transferase superfamily protein [Kangiella sp.]|nr:4'-phosphopantetheinyl transferase superfamily protein [Kangiella sp.]